MSDITDLNNKRRANNGRGTTTELRGNYLADPESEVLKDMSGSLPIWVKCPPSGYDVHTGLSRAKLYELAGLGLIRSVSLRRKGQVKGSRLFHLQSLLDYITKMEHANQ